MADFTHSYDGTEQALRLDLNIIPEDDTSPVSGRNMHALIIEDEFFTALLIEDCLRALRYTTFAFARDVEEAITAASERCPDLITSDVQLSPGCGIDAVQHICEDKPIPVVYITGTAMLVRERCPGAAMIRKPFGLADLREGVRQALRVT